MAALLLVWLAWFGALPQGAAPPAPGIECSTCKGTARALQDCLVCKGSKRVDCATCLPNTWGADDLQLGGAARTPELEESLRKLREELRKLRERETELYGDAAGYAVCPNMCVRGKTILNPKAPCKYCEGKGLLSCPRCKKKSELRCAACEGRGQVQRACEDCLGTGRRKDPATIAPEARSACPVCAGVGTWGCRECDEKGFAESTCRACNGEGRMPCGQCLGSRQRPCNKCSGTGDLSSYLAAKTSNRCDQCNANGRIACEKCEQGSVACPSCKGKRRLPQRCLACQVSHVRPCLGCSQGAFRSWELAGVALLSAGDLQGARSFLEIARGRVDACYEQLARTSGDPKAAAKSLEKERKAQLERLDKRIAATQKPAK